MSQSPLNLDAWNEFAEGRERTESESEEEEKVCLDIDRTTGKFVATLPGTEKRYKVYMMFSDEELESFCEELENSEHGREGHSDGTRSGLSQASQTGVQERH